MLRQVDINIDVGTWPNPPAKPTFPSSFHSGSAPVSFSIPRLLLTIGVLTTPTDPIGPTLSQYWAFVRYLSAITAGPDLRITQAFASLDSHQKMILSDDFGMGLPMSWLLEKLSAFGFCDGQYFIKALASAVGAKAPKKARRGPNKSPDFVLLDFNGDWHVVECKGTQSGPGYRDKQLGKKPPKTTGGIAQKHSIIFPRACLGQRLACGVSIGVEEGPFPTELRIVDPTRPAVFTVMKEWLPEAKEITARAMLARSLRLAGFEAAATYIAANGPMPKGGIRRRFKLERLEHLRRLAEAELRDTEPANRVSFLIGDSQFVGRSVSLDLSQANEYVGGVYIQQGITSDLFEQLLTLDIADKRRESLAPEIVQSAAGIEFAGDGEEASLRIGSAFKAQLDLRRRTEQRLRPSGD